MLQKVTHILFTVVKLIVGFILYLTVPAIIPLLIVAVPPLGYFLASVIALAVIYLMITVKGNPDESSADGYCESYEYY